MFEREIRDTPARSIGAMLELTFHAAVRNVRKSSGNPVVGLLVNIMQSVILIAVFLVMFELIGTGRPRIHGGDTVLFVMSGVMIFMAHVKALGAVAGSDGPTSPMMKHSPMNQVVAIWSAALSALYLQVLSAVVILFLYHAVWKPITIHQPVETMGTMLLAWLSGVALGMVVQAARPWWPAGVGLIQSVYARMNMIFSGKMFVANLMPGYIIAFFDWNPLFHMIDQTRGFVFLNYNPHFSNLTYPIVATAVFFAIGLIGEFYSRQHVSASWGAGK